MSELSHNTAQEVLKNEMAQRLLNSQLEIIKAQAAIAKASADVAKAKGDGVAAARQAAVDAGQAQKDGSAVPPIAVAWIAGPANDLEAQIRIAKYGSIVVKKGSRIPIAQGVLVETVTPSGLILKDPSGKLYPVAFTGG
jgi:hypothetical protein